MANFSPNRAAGRIGRDQGKNAKPLRNAGVVGSAESGCLGRVGAGGGRAVQTDQGAISQRSVMGRGFSAANGNFSSCCQGLTCATASPGEFSHSLVRREPFDRTVG